MDKLCSVVACRRYGIGGIERPLRHVIRQNANVTKTKKTKTQKQNIAAVLVAAVCMHNCIQYATSNVRVYDKTRKKKRTSTEQNRPTDRPADRQHIEITFGNYLLVKCIISFEL